MSEINFALIPWKGRLSLSSFIPFLFSLFPIISPFWSRVTLTRQKMAKWHCTHCSVLSVHVCFAWCEEEMSKLRRGKRSEKIVNTVALTLKSRGKNGEMSAGGKQLRFKWRLNSNYRGVFGGAWKYKQVRIWRWRHGKLRENFTGECIPYAAAKWLKIARSPLARFMPKLVVVKKWRISAHLIARVK